MGQREDLAGLSGAEAVAMLGLVPLPEEGGTWREVWRDERSTAIYFLIRPGDFSAMHRLDGPELWHHYAGAAVQMLLLGLGLDQPKRRRAVHIRWSGSANTGLKSGGKKWLPKFALCNIKNHCI